MDEIIVGGVRCFYEWQSIPLRKLTVLVGENSSGKSTFLALTRIAWSVAQGDTEIDFNEEPFLLGAFDQIASFSKRVRAKEFTVGVKFKEANVANKASGLEVVGTFTKSDVQPVLSRWIVESSGHQILTPNLAKSSEWHLLLPNGEAQLVAGKDLVSGKIGLQDIDFITSYFSTAKRHFSPQLLEVQGTLPPSHELRYIANMLRVRKEIVGPKPYAFAPIRSQPRRTYDPLREAPEPQGSHVPMVLARISSGEPQNWQQLVQALRRFGRSSGLFTDVEVRRMAKGEGEPFQIRVTVSDAAFNLVDVGYGVSQILPIIVDVLRAEEEGTFLLQQPEVHLHPQAQAELGSFLATLATTTGKRFVVETHSDYLVDRIRMDIRDRRNIEPKDVQILYFERQNGKVKVHPIEIDENGNLESVPKGYRSFFLEEERRFLGG